MLPASSSAFEVASTTCLSELRFMPLSAQGRAASAFSRIVVSPFVLKEIVQAFFSASLRRSVDVGRRSATALRWAWVKRMA